MENLLDYSLKEIEKVMLDMGEQKFRAGQIFTSLYQGKSFSEMTNISYDLKNRLTENYVAQPCTILDKKMALSNFCSNLAITILLKVCL